MALEPCMGCNATGKIGNGVFHGLCRGTGFTETNPAHQSIAKPVYLEPGSINPLIAVGLCALLGFIFYTPDPEQGAIVGGAVGFGIYLINMYGRYIVMAAIACALFYFFGGAS